MGAPDGGDHIVRFRKHCHALVVAGYERIRNESHDKSEEDWITQRIVEEVKSSQRERSLPRWSDRDFIRDQVPVSGEGRIGIERPKIDIEVESAEKCRRPIFHFEAKRLRADDSHSVSEYVGRAGLGSFLDELYARSGGEGGMLGYVQSKSPEHWADAIERKLQRSKRSDTRLRDDGHWQVVSLLKKLDCTYSTRHDRPKLGPITVFHTLLDFR